MLFSSAIRDFKPTSAPKAAPLPPQHCLNSHDTMGLAGLSGIGTISAPRPDLMRPRRRSRLAIGFLPRSRAIYRAYNMLIALVLLLLILPLGTMIALALLITQGRPIFFRGARIGEGGETFGIFKYRTLDSAKAAILTSDRVLPAGSGLETPLGLFLRETRLDELPQLFNVLRGDMNMCGPRPVRAEIAAIKAVEIPGYEARFSVKPGMIGPAQAFMSHGTSKAIRSRLNNKICRSPVSYRGEIYLITIVAACVLARTGARLLRYARSLRRRSEEERLRIGLPGGRPVQFVAPCGTVREVEWIDETALRLRGKESPLPLRKGRLILNLPNGQARGVNVSLCEASGNMPESGQLHSYRPMSAFGEHILSRYFFQKVVVPHRSEFLAAQFARLLRDHKMLRS